MNKKREKENEEWVRSGFGSPPYPFIAKREEEEREAPPSLAFLLIFNSLYFCV